MVFPQTYSAYYSLCQSGKHGSRLRTTFFGSSLGYQLSSSGCWHNALLPFPIRSTHVAPIITFLHLGYILKCAVFIEKLKNKFEILISPVALNEHSKTALNEHSKKTSIVFFLINQTVFEMDFYL